MAVRKKKQRRQKSLANTGTNEITVEQHGRAYRMWMTGVDPRDIQRECRLTARQWAWLFRTGDASKNLPSFESMWIEEVTAIRGSAVDAAKEISTRSPAVIRRHMVNAEAAGLILNRMLGHWYEQLAEGGDVEKSIPSEDAIKAMKVLKEISSGKDAAETFRAIYTERAGARAVQPAFDLKGADDPLGRLADPSEAEDAPVEITNGFWSDWQRMTPEQQAAYLADGTEPDPKDMLDAEATER